MDSLQTVVRDGYMWADYNCVVMRPGVANGMEISAAVLAVEGEKFEGAPVFLDHARDGRASVRDLVGMIADVSYDAAGQQVVGVLRLLRGRSEVAEQVRAFRGQGRVFGLSADMWVKLDKGGGLAEIVEVVSVDLVAFPAAGGAVGEERVAEQKEEAAMEEEARYEVARVQMGGAGDDDSGAGGDDSPGDASEEIASLQRQVVAAQLQASGLPTALADGIRSRFEGGLLPFASVSADIAAHKAAWAASEESRTVQGLGPIGGMKSSVDRIEAAFAKLMGVPIEGFGDVARLSGVREMYDLLTGDWERRGLFQPSRVRLANVTTSTMAVVTANVLNKVLLAGYNAMPQWWKPIAYEEDFPSMQAARWITLGGFSDLSTVAEGGSYTEKTWDDYEETASFSKKGNYVGLTLEMIDKDDVASFRQIPRKLGLAAQRTLSASVSALFTANSGTGATLADTDVLFHANHSNVGSTALSADTWDAAIQAMYQQAEYHSSKAIGVRPRYLLVPIELEKTALGIFTTDLAMPVEPNNIYWRRNAGNVITVPDWTDANNWYAAADPNEAQGVCIGYRFGREPELFVADSNVQGSMFTNDEMRIKVRFVYAVGIGDYRALYGAIVA